MAAGDLTFNGYKRVNRGRCPCISVLWEEKVAVVVTDFSFSPGMSYYVGELLTDGNINWGSARSYTTGKCPRIVLVKKEDGIYAVEAHNPVFSLGSSSNYHVWKLDRSSDTMTGEMKGIPFEAGLYPRLCANTEGQVVAVGEHQDGILMSSINFTDGSPHMNWKTRSLTFTIDYNPHIDMCGDKIIIAFTKNLYIRVMLGKFKENKVTITRSYDTNIMGMYPSIAINNRDQVFLSYQTLTERKLVFMRYKINDRSDSFNKELAITSDETTTLGEYPSVCLSNDGVVYVVYKVNFGRIIRIKTGNMHVNPNGNETREEESNV